MLIPDSPLALRALSEAPLRQAKQSLSCYHRNGFLIVKRWFFFSLSIILGLALGLLLGWWLLPWRTSRAPASALRIDYKTDYVLMVAEDFRLRPDLELANHRLSVLGSSSSLSLISQAMLFAARAGYSSADLALMQALADAFTEGNPGLPYSPVDDPAAP